MNPSGIEKAETPLSPLSRIQTPLSTRSHPSTRKGKLSGRSITPVEHNYEKTKFPEPVCALIRLAMFSYQGEQTKFHFDNNSMQFHKIDPAASTYSSMFSNYTVGIYRWASGASHHDFRYLEAPLILASQWYPIKDYSTLSRIYKIALRGLIRCTEESQTYPDNTIPALRRYCDIVGDIIEGRSYEVRPFHKHNPLEPYPIKDKAESEKYWPLSMLELIDKAFENAENEKKSGSPSLPSKIQAIEEIVKGVEEQFFNDLNT